MLEHPHTSLYIGFIFEQQALSEMLTVCFFLFFLLEIFFTSTINIHKKQSRSRHNRAVCLEVIFQQSQTNAWCLHLLIRCVIYRQSFLIFNVHHAARALNIFSRSIDHRIGFFRCLHRCFIHLFDGCPFGSEVHECILVPRRSIQKPIPSTLDPFGIRFSFIGISVDGNLRGRNLSCSRLLRQMN